MTQPRDQVYPVQKLKYVSGHRPQVACILCAVVERNPEVVGLEIARTALFLVSDAAHFINGAVIDINGGRFLR